MKETGRLKPPFVTVTSVLETVDGPESGDWFGIRCTVTRALPLATSHAGTPVNATVVVPVCPLWLPSRAIARPAPWLIDAATATPLPFVVATRLPVICAYVR